MEYIFVLAIILGGIYALLLFLVGPYSYWFGETSMTSRDFDKLIRHVLPHPLPVQRCSYCGRGIDRSFINCVGCGAPTK